MTTFHRSCKFTRLGWLLSFTLSTALLLSSCSSLKTTPVEKPEEPVSIITGKSGGTKFSDLMRKDSTGDGLPVNALLWRAALDIASFVPLDDIDTFGGSIVTEWYAPDDQPFRRLKLAVFVVGVELRSDAVQVRAYVQVKSADNKDWVSVGRDESLSRKLEDLILTRARELRAAAVSETSN